MNRSYPLNFNRTSQNRKIMKKICTANTNISEKACRKNFILPFLIVLILNISGGSAGNTVQIWSSLPDMKALLIQKEQTMASVVGDVTGEIKIFADQSCQTVEGVGAALTHSSAYVFHHNLNPDQRDSLFRLLFTPEGIGINYTRLCIGSSDFSSSLFSYSETEDFSLSNFSIRQDYDDVIPMLNEILAINPHLQIMATPWSPPGWMKTSGSMVGGRLRTDCYDVYADYLIKFIEAYQKEGITIHTLSVQNEPEYGTANYPCMDMSAEEQKIFIRDHLGPKMRTANIATKIILFDHNCDSPNYPISIMNDPEAKKFVDGSGFHLYKGEISALCAVHEAHPDKNLYFTEQSGGGWAPDFDQNIRWYVGHLFSGAMNCWSKNVLLWNLALDENDGPKNFGCQDCWGVVRVKTDGQIEQNAEYYAIGHYGKVVQQGAKRLVSIADDINGVAFHNPDDSYAYLGVYDGKDQKVVRITCGNTAFNYRLSPGEVFSFKWNSK